MEQTQKLREYLARTKGARYPFEGHKLAELEDYSKNLYVDQLRRTGTALRRAVE